MSDAIFEKLVQIIVDNLGVDPSEVTKEASITEDLNADSLEIYEIVVAIEQEFNISIPDEAAESIATVGDAYQFIKSKL